MDTKFKMPLMLSISTKSDSTISNYLKERQTLDTDFQGRQHANKEDFNVDVEAWKVDVNTCRRVCP